MHSLDMHTSAKEAFITTFEKKIIEPRGLKYKIQFCGPTGTNATEAAIKLAKKIKKRNTVFSFMGGYHGMTAGSLAATGNLDDRQCVSSNLNGVVFFPYPSKEYANIDTIAYMDAVLSDDHSGVEKPAAIIYETVQAEGGINMPPSFDWFKQLRELCDRHDILLICDDIQVGCYRTGKFFSFEHAGIAPDMVALSKSISGCGFPMALLLIKPEYDDWEPGEHTGTFRGFQLAMVGATAAIEFAEQADIEKVAADGSAFLEDFLNNRIKAVNKDIMIRGLGMIWGIDLSKTDIDSKKVSELCYKNGLIIETAGRNGRVLKIIPPLTTDRETLKRGCEIIENAIKKLS